MKKFLKLIELYFKSDLCYYIKQDVGVYKKAIRNGIVLTNSYKFSLKSIIKFYYILYCIYRLPVEIIDRLNNEKITIKLTSLKDMIEISGTPSGGFFGACGDQKIIFLCIQFDIRFKILKEIFYHEIGHLVDKCMLENKTNKINENDDEYYSIEDLKLQAVFVKENNIFSDDYYKSDICEYFAEAFAQIMCKNKYFIENAILTTSIVNNYIESL